MTPKLTIGIPHLDRSEFLHRAIDSCLRNTIPVHIIVADQGHTEQTAQIMRRYKDHPHIQHEPSNATCLWENWEFCARHCDTPYFCWCQDDDVVGRGYASRIVHAFERWPEATHWQARCHNGKDEKFAAWFSGNGPWVPLEMLDGLPSAWHGEVIPPTMYFTSWSLSPGVAFRCGENFNAALSRMPKNADLFAERLILAYLGAKGQFVADPVIAGYWIHHGGNESYKQHATQTEQEQVCYDHLDDVLDECRWQDIFFEWCTCMPVLNVVQWSQHVEKIKTRHKEELIQIMQRSMVGRIEVVKQAEAMIEAQEPALTTAGQDLIWWPAGSGTRRIAS